MKSKIEFLPEHLIDQIKAGEVIERPSNLIKELVENAIDAESSEIYIHIKNAGMDLVAIEDNGIGIEFEQLPLAFTRHATSKIQDFEDIYHLLTYGFRGEALASISSISRVTCYSKPISEEGAKYVIHGAKQIEYQKHPLNKEGTSFYIKDLFYNTPARLKFIKSQSSEKKQIQKLIHSFILSHPEITFKIKWDEGEKKIYPKTEDLKKRLRQLWSGKDFEVFHFQQSYEGHEINTYYSSATGKTNSHKFQFLFANKRLIEDKKLHAQALRALENYWGKDNFGHYLIDIKVPEDQIDVNIHPQKTFVKFLKASVVYSLISNGLKNSFQKEKLTTSVGQNFDQKENIEKGIYNLFSIGEKFSLYKKDHQTYLIKTSKLLPHLLTSFWKKNYPVDEDLCLPLLIGAPFTNDSLGDDDFKELKNLGFHFDRLDEDSIILRAIPDLNISIDYNKIGHWMVENYKDIQNYETLQKKDLFLNEREANEIIQKSSLHCLPWVKVIEEKDIEKLLT